MALSNKSMGGKKPAWTEHQQKETKSKTREEAKGESKTKKASTKVKLYMLSDYRDVAKKGKVWETDAEKAEELIKLKRAEKYDSKKHKNK